MGQSLSLRRSFFQWRHRWAEGCILAVAQATGPLESQIGLAKSRQASNARAFMRVPRPGWAVQIPFQRSLESPGRCLRNSRRQCPGRRAFRLDLFSPAHDTTRQRFGPASGHDSDLDTNWTGAMNGPDRVSAGLIARSILLPLSAILLGSATLSAQDKNSTPGEVASRDNEPQFKFEVQRNLVLVRVVVRDAKGQPVGGLHKADFRLLDSGKPQTIISFAEEAPQVPPKEEAGIDRQQAADQPES